MLKPRVYDTNNLISLEQYNHLHSAGQLKKKKVSRELLQEHALEHTGEKFQSKV
jgi:hypothetical protein